MEHNQKGIVMTRTLSALGAAGLIACAAAASAQTRPATTTDDKWDSKEMTITGCVEKTKSGGYFLIHAMESSAATTTGTSGSAATTTAGSTTTAEKSDRDGHMTWNL